MTYRPSINSPQKVTRQHLHDDYSYPHTVGTTRISEIHTQGIPRIQEVVQSPTIVQQQHIHNVPHYVDQHPNPSQVIYEGQPRVVRKIIQQAPSQQPLVSYVQQPTGIQDLEAMKYQLKEKQSTIEKIHQQTIETYKKLQENYQLIDHIKQDSREINHVDQLIEENSMLKKLLSEKEQEVYTYKEENQKNELIDELKMCNAADPHQRADLINSLLEENSRLKTQMQSGQDYNETSELKNQIHSLQKENQNLKMNVRQHQDNMFSTEQNTKSEQQNMISALKKLQNENQQLNQILSSNPDELVEQIMQMNQTIERQNQQLQGQDQGYQQYAPQRPQKQNSKPPGEYGQDNFGNNGQQYGNYSSDPKYPKRNEQEFLTCFHNPTINRKPVEDLIPWFHNPNVKAPPKATNPFPDFHNPNAPKRQVVDTFPNFRNPNAPKEKLTEIPRFHTDKKGEYPAKPSTKNNIHASFHDQKVQKQKAEKDPYPHFQNDLYPRSQKPVNVYPHFHDDSVEKPVIKDQCPDFHGDNNPNRQNAQYSRKSQQEDKYPNFHETNNPNRSQEGQNPYPSNLSKSQKKPSVETNNMYNRYNDKEEFTGEKTNARLFVTICNCRSLKGADKLSDPDPFVTYQLSNDKTKKENTSVVNNNKNPDFNHNSDYTLTQITEQELESLKVSFYVYDRDVMSNTLIGGVTIPIRDHFKRAGTWISDYYELLDAESKTDIGYICIQMKLMLQGQNQIEHQPPVPKFEQYKENKSTSKTYPGILTINIPCARNLPSSILDKADPYVEIRLNKGDKKKLKTSTIDDNPNPVWNFSGEYTLDLKQEDWKALILMFKVMDYDTMKDDLIGQNSVDISQLFSKPGEWINQVYELQNKKGKNIQGDIYLQIKWMPYNKQYYPFQVLNDQQNPKNIMYQWIEDHTTKQMKKEAAKQQINMQSGNPIVSGIIKIYAVQAKYLIAADSLGSSDPYVEFKITEGSKNSFHTKVISKNINPTWEEHGEIKVSLKKDSFAGQSLLVTVFDSDFGADDFLGQLSLSLNDAFKQKRPSWINKVYELRDKKGVAGGNGIISMMYMWLPENSGFAEDLPRSLNIDTFYRGVPPKGHLMIYAKGAKSLMGVKNQNKTADPWLKVIFADEEQNTHVSKDTLDPNWNEIFHLKCNYHHRKMVPKLKIEVYSGSYSAFHGYQFLGDFEFDCTNVLEYPDTWGITQEFQLTNLQNRKTEGTIKGLVNLKVGFATADNKKKTFKLDNK